MMILLVLFGGAISGGGLLREVTWAVVLFVVLTIFLVRPLIGWISLAGRDQPADEKAVISFFGILGLGSAYYLAYGLGHASFEQPNLLWGAVGLVMLCSIVLHGVTVTPVMRHLDRRRSPSHSPREGSTALEADL
jgi:NhaP-type Na+/H+ or K+/H+ antiporter